jgi:hypothetical protein
VRIQGRIEGIKDGKCSSTFYKLSYLLSHAEPENSSDTHTKLLSVSKLKRRLWYGLTMLSDSHRRTAGTRPEQPLSMRLPDGNSTSKSSGPLATETNEVQLTNDMTDKVREHGRAGALLTARKESQTGTYSVPGHPAAHPIEARLHGKEYL